MPDPPIVLVTGASRGIGAAVAYWLAAVGAGVALVARSNEKLDTVADHITRLGGTPLTLAGDVASEDFCTRSVAQTRKTFGRLDALVNNAGTFEPLAFTADAEPAAWQQALAVNLLGPFYLSRAALPALRKREGRIVNVSSGAATRPLAGAGAYCAAKAALNHFTQVLAVEEPAVTSITVRPGVVDTEMQVLIRSKGPGVMPAEQAAFYHNLKAQGRLEPPWVPARAIAWLALRVPSTWSGRFLNYDDPEIRNPAIALFGESPAILDA